MQNGKIMVAENQDVYVLKFMGDVRLTLCSTIDSLLKRIFGGELKSVVVDLTETDGIDSTALGLLAKIAVNAKGVLERKPTIISTRTDITHILETMGFEHYFEICREPVELGCCMQEAPIMDECAESVRQKVIDAHRILMGLNPKNKAEFEPVVFALENCPAAVGAEDSTTRH